MLLRTLSLLLFIGLFLGCTRDAVVAKAEECPTEPITYDDDIRVILNTYCSYSGCHDGVRPEDFRSYDAMAPWLTEDKFESEVIGLSMPPGNAPEDVRIIPDDKLVLITCWIQQGYLEN